MKIPPLLSLLLALSPFCGIRASAAFFYVAANSTNATPPYSDWSTAATNIQDAIDAASAGDTVLVTNGIYSGGGKVMASDLTNRVALDKALTVQSVNGPLVTIIAGPGAPSGTAAIRCAWLTNNAALIGFTLQGGSARPGDSGGGAWCASASSLVANCIIRFNSVNNMGGGAFQGTLRNCFITQNGGFNGSGVAFATLNNCTIVSNTPPAAYQCTMTNCIVYFNTNAINGTANWSSCQGRFSCTTPALIGTGNTTSDPQLFLDGIHLSKTSPCRGTGINPVTSTDILGQSWSNPPSMGCAEWQSFPYVTPPALQLSTSPFGFTVRSGAAGEPPFTYSWLKDGVQLTDDSHFSGSQTTNLIVSGLNPSDSGAYQLVTSNAFGVSTSAVANFVLHFVDAANSSPLAPYTNWTSAAANIQDAIDAANGGEFIIVTNGVYSNGGKTTAGGLTNRVTLDKPLTVQSVNGPFFTIIQGPGIAPGPTAVRCAWVTNGAALIGFTIQGGGTFATSIDDGQGAGVFCSANAIVANCIIRSNLCAGSIAYSGLLKNCLLTLNVIPGGVVGRLSVFNNCTITSNAPTALNQCSLINSIVYFNSNTITGGTSTADYCCISSGFSGPHIISSNPQFLADNLHFLNTSPCRNAGTNISGSTDIFGQPWANPPTMGCAEWQALPFIAPITFQLSGDPVGFSVSAIMSGSTPMTFYWLKESVLITDNDHYAFSGTTNLLVRGLTPADAGIYQLVASNAFGVVTSAVTQLPVHYVDAANSAPVSPYSSWATASTNIQDAINIAKAGDIVFVTNGVYANGGKSFGGGTLTNRVMLDKAITLQSVSGPTNTIIQGAWDPVTTNGPLAIRCAWLTNGATLSGFMLCNGATLSGGPDSLNQQSGGGAIGPSSTNAVLFNCCLSNNAAYFVGGGAYNVTLNNCTLIANQTLANSLASGGGGGAKGSRLRNCLVTQNISGFDGGGILSSSATNCAITKNIAYTTGGGCASAQAFNCTVTGNSARNFFQSPGCAGGAANGSLANCIIFGNLLSGTNRDYFGATLNFCCSTPMSAGTGNITVDPQLLGDGIHLADTSPCRSAGSSTFVVGADIDGQSWSNPPSIGCDEWVPQPMVVVQPAPQVDLITRALSISATAAGQPPFTCQWIKDGNPVTDDSHYSSSSSPNLIIKVFAPSDTGTYQVIVSNSFGVATSQVVQATIHGVDASCINSMPPYTDWSAAATNIQDAIDVSSPGDIILVTNGIYASGGKVMSGDLTNRIAIDKPVTVVSVNGFASTVLEGVRDPATNGPTAVRCAWLTNGATLIGFTLQGGATRRTGFVTFDLDYAGGLWCAPVPSPVQANSPTAPLVGSCLVTSNSAEDAGGSFRGTFVNCVFTNNFAQNNGGGVYNSTLKNCLLLGNIARVNGGGASFGFLINCTVTANIAGTSSSRGGGLENSIARNCIVWENYYHSFTTLDISGTANYDTINSTFFNCCTDPPRSASAGNIDSLPQFLNNYHLSTTSPCRGTGSTNLLSGVDLDGLPWANPPSMGCYEVVETNLIGPLQVALQMLPSDTIFNMRPISVHAIVTGHPTQYTWSVDDGTFITNASFFFTRIWTNVGDFNVTFTAYNNDNPNGVSTNAIVHIVPFDVPTLETMVSSTNAFQFQFTAQTNVNYDIQMATNLTAPVTWQKIQTIFFSTGGVTQITDTNATNDTRFYRLKLY